MEMSVVQIKTLEQLTLEGHTFRALEHEQLQGLTWASHSAEAKLIPWDMLMKVFSKMSSFHPNHVFTDAT